MPQPRPLRDQPEPQILRDVGVLILVHQNVLESPLILREHLGVLAKQPDTLQQQVAEIGGVENLQPLLERLVELSPFRWRMPRPRREEPAPA